MFCNVIMVSSLYVHGCVKDTLARTGWKIRPRPETDMNKRFQILSPSSPLREMTTEGDWRKQGGEGGGESNGSTLVAMVMVVIVVVVVVEDVWFNWQPDRYCFKAVCDKTARHF